MFMQSTYRLQAVFRWHDLRRYLEHLKIHKVVFSSDVNECEGDHLCTELCINTPGSYDCSCPSGYALDEDDGITCHSIYMHDMVYA